MPFRHCILSVVETAVLLSGFFFTGCGYSFRATGEAMGIDLESMAIPMIESTSSDIGFEADFTRVIREEFIRNSKVPLVSTEDAQTVLSGRVTDIRTEALGYDLVQKPVNEVATTYEETRRRMLRVKVDMEFTDRKTGKTIWQEKDLEEKASFVVDRDPLVTQFNEKQTLEIIADRLAKRIFLRTMERF
jgi:hypothetical protein